MIDYIRWYNNDVRPSTYARDVLYTPHQYSGRSPLRWHSGDKAVTGVVLRSKSYTGATPVVQRCHWSATGVPLRCISHATPVWLEWLRWKLAEIGHSGENLRSHRSTDGVCAKRRIFWCIWMLSSDVENFAMKMCYLMFYKMTTNDGKKLKFTRD